MQLLILALLVATAPVDQARADWYECLEIYSQTAMFSRTSSATLAMQALQACAPERGSFQQKLLRAPSTLKAKPDGPAFTTMLADEDRKAVLHVIAFVTRYRPKR